MAMTWSSSVRACHAIGLWRRRAAHYPCQGVPGSQSRLVCAILAKADSAVHETSCWCTELSANGPQSHLDLRHCQHASGASNN